MVSPFLLLYFSRNSVVFMCPVNLKFSFFSFFKYFDVKFQQGLLLLMTSYRAQSATPSPLRWTPPTAVGIDPLPPWNLTPRGRSGPGSPHPKQHQRAHAAPMAIVLALPRPPPPLTVMSHHLLKAAMGTVWTRTDPHLSGARTSA